MNTVRRVALLARSNARQVSQTSVQSAKAEVHPGYARIKEIQKQFQIDDGKPVHLKKGLSDSILYHLTMGLCVVAVILDFKLIYDLSYPKKPE